MYVFLKYTLSHSFFCLFFVVVLTRLLIYKPAVRVILPLSSLASLAGLNHDFNPVFVSILESLFHLQKKTLLILIS